MYKYVIPVKIFFPDNIILIKILVNFQSRISNCQLQFWIRCRFDSSFVYNELWFKPHLGSDFQSGIGFTLGSVWVRCEFVMVTQLIVKNQENSKYSLHKYFAWVWSMTHTKLSYTIWVHVKIHNSPFFGKIKIWNCVVPIPSGTCSRSSESKPFIIISRNIFWRRITWPSIHDQNSVFKVKRFASDYWKI